MINSLHTKQILLGIVLGGAALGAVHQHYPSFLNSLLFSNEIPGWTYNNEVKKFDLLKFNSKFSDPISTLRANFLGRYLDIKRNCIDTKGLNSLDRTKIPYSINDQDIKKHVCDLRAPTKNTHYWTDINKNNEKGEITVSVYGRAHAFNLNLLDDVHSTTKLSTHTITGFQKMDPKDIVKERTLGVYLNRNNSGLSYRSFSKQGFTHTGSGVIFKKDPNLPKYYILTAKHLFKNIVYTVGTSQDKTWTMSPVDHAHYYNLRYKNLKNFINFGTAMTDEEKLKVNPYSPMEVSSSYIKTLLPQDNIKELLLVKDFSETFTEARENKQLFHNWNKDYKSLTNIHGNKKITLDAVVLSIEFNNSNQDPFASWWNQRPSQYRLLEERDFNSDPEYHHHLSVGPERTQEDIYLGGYQWREINSTFQDMVVAKGALHVSKYDFKNQNFNKYNAYGKSGNIHYSNRHNQLVGGSSGGGVFDKNLKIIGVNWGGSADVNHILNIFSWLGISPELSKIYQEENLRNVPKELRDWQKAGQIYNYFDF